MAHVEHRRDNFLISTDKSKLQLPVIHEFLTNAYWAQGRSLAVVERSIENSMCFGVYDGEQHERQVGFARVITDCTTFAYLSDLFILEPYRGRGLSKWLVESILDHPDLRGMRRWLLGTRDAHKLYSRYGFEVLQDTGRYMTRLNPDADQPPRRG